MNFNSLREILSKVLPYLFCISPVNLWCFSCSVFLPSTALCSQLGPGGRTHPNTMCSLFSLPFNGQEVHIFQYCITHQCKFQRSGGSSFSSIRDIISSEEGLGQISKQLNATDMINFSTYSCLYYSYQISAFLPIVLYNTYNH